MKHEKYFKSIGYKILDKVGQGASGEVFRAQSQEEGEIVAIKLLSEKIAQEENFQIRFVREMKIIKSLSHPHIVRALDYGIEEARHLYYVVLEYVDGESLQELLAREGRLSYYQCLRITREVSEALQYACDEGLVHRDIKPGNILIDQRGECKITDFGLVKTNRSKNVSLTSSGAILGTPYYLAPEQALASKRVDIRADIYSLGITLYHMLTGRPPFDYDNPLRIVTAHCYNPLPSVAEIRPGIPPQIEELLEKMTRKERERRFATPREIVEKIKEIEDEISTEVLEGLGREEKKEPSPEESSVSQGGASTIKAGSSLLTGNIHKRLLKLGDHLVREGLLSPGELDELLDEESIETESLPNWLCRRTGVSHEEVARILADYYRLPLVFPDQIPIPEEVLALIDEEQAQKWNCIPIQREKEKILLAVEDPLVSGPQQEVQFKTGLKVKLAVAPHDSLRQAIEKNYHLEESISEFMDEEDFFDSFEMAPSEEEQKKIQGLDEREMPEDIEEVNPSSAPIVKLVQSILVQALEKGASDIHIEPMEKIVRLRYRIDGVLSEEREIPNWLLRAVVSRIKILSDLDIAERRVPQDGRITFKYQGNKIICRVSTLPTHRGEKVVIRILDPGGALLSLADLGLTSKCEKYLNRAIQRPQGIILTTGPTGSGKSTTLYSILSKIQSPDINIITVEDPVEYELEGINQVQVRPKAGLTFAAALRSILRQDPDVILVGEMRDLETAEIGFESAMTGHLVLSTLHTNDSIATVTRLLELGLDPFVVASALELILAQRLARRICSHCKEPYTPKSEILEQYEDLRDLTFYRGKGCETCDQRGYKGRVGLYEFLPITPRVRETIQVRAREEEIRQAGEMAGMMTLWQAALEKIRSGETTIEEVLRVVQTAEGEEINCPNCKSQISPNFVSCPYCREALKVVCQRCERSLEPDWVICPYCNAAQNLDSQEESSPVVAPTILVADDDPQVNEVIVNFLKEIYPQAKIVSVPNGKEALAKSKIHKLDMALLDVKMPGFTGVEVCSQLRSQDHYKSLPILLITAEYNDEVKEDAYLAGADDFLSKPVNFLEIKSKVEKCLNR